MPKVLNHNHLSAVAQTEGQGFLLTRQWRDTAQGIQLVFWLATERGGKQLKIEGEKAIFFVPAEAQSQIDAVLKKFKGSYSRVLALSDFSGRPVLGCYFLKREHLREAAEWLRKDGVAVFEDDILPHDRYLMERFIFGGVHYRYLNADMSQQDGAQTRVDLKHSECVVALKMVSFDIETSMDGNELFSIAVYAQWQGATYEQVFMVDDREHDAYQSCRTGADVLKQFLRWVKVFDPDVLIGWNVVNFDLRQLEKFGKRWGIPIVLGRDQSILHLRAMGDDDQRYQAIIAGRVVLDGIEVLKTATYRFESFALDAVARQVLGEGKLLQGAQRGEDIARLFVVDKPQLAAYNLKDAELVWQIFEKTQLLEFAIERTRLTGLPLDRVGGSVASFDYRYLPLLHREGFVAPNGHHADTIEHSPGGLVLSSQPGLYDHVLVFDFKSLYPSIIRSFLIDPLGLVLADLQRAEDHNTVEGFKGGKFSRDRHLLPDIIRQLWEARDGAKRHNNMALSQAIKIIMNSFYGVLGSSGCRFFDARLASSITQRGHQIIQTTVRLIEAQGYRVIYGDTDSVFVWLADVHDDADAQRVGKQLQHTINAYWQNHLKREWQLQSALEIQFERHFRRFMMPTIRGSMQGSKKRYAGLSVSASGEEEIVFRGLEAVRTDWTMLARRTQQELYRRVFYGESYEAYLCSVVSDLRAGRCDHELIYRKRLRQKLEDYRKNIPPHAQAALIGAAEGLTYRVGDWVEYVMTIQGAFPVALPVREKLDYEHYVTTQLAPPVDAILQFSGKTLSSLIDEQLSLL